MNLLLANKKLIKDKTNKAKEKTKINQKVLQKVRKKGYHKLIKFLIIMV